MHTQSPEISSLGVTIWGFLGLTISPTARTPRNSWRTFAVARSLLSLAGFTTFWYCSVRALTLTHTAKCDRLQRLAMSSCGVRTHMVSSESARSVQIPSARRSGCISSTTSVSNLSIAALSFLALCLVCCLPYDTLVSPNHSSSPARSFRFFLFHCSSSPTQSPASCSCGASTTTGSLVPGTARPDQHPHRSRVSPISTFSLSRLAWNTQSLSSSE